MKPEFIYELKEDERVRVTVYEAVIVDDDLDISRYTGTLTGIITGIEDNVDRLGMSGIYLDFEEKIFPAPPIVYLCHTEIDSIEKL